MRAPLIIAYTTLYCSSESNALATSFKEFAFRVLRAFPIEVSIHSRTLTCAEGAIATSKSQSSSQMVAILLRSSFPTGALQKGHLIFFPCSTSDSKTRKEFVHRLQVRRTPRGTRFTKICRRTYAGRQRPRTRVEPCSEHCFPQCIGVGTVSELETCGTSICPRRTFA